MKIYHPPVPEDGLLERLIHQARKLSIQLALPPQTISFVGSLAIASTINGALLLTRILTTGDGAMLFLVWNLFLAWVPLALAMAAHRERTRTTRFSIRLWLYSAGWLLFLPNAHYMVTDLIHLRARAGVPIWVDLILIVSFAWTGLMLGFLSLHLMHRLVARRHGGVTGWLFVLTTLTLTGLGLYIGRFLRWNSWDIFLSPSLMLRDILLAFGQPFTHPAPLVYTILFTVFVGMAHVTLHSLTRIQTTAPLSEPAPVHTVIRPVPRNPRHSAGSSAPLDPSA